MHLFPHVHTSFAFPFVDYLINNGCPAPRYVSMAKLPDALLDQTDGFVSEHHVYRLLDHAARREGIDDFGLQVAQTVPLTTLGKLGEQVAAMPGMYAGLDLFCHRIGEKVISHVGFWLSRHDGKIWFCRTPPPGIDGDQTHPEQFAVQFMLKLIRVFTGEHWSPAELWLRANNKRGFTSHPDYENTVIHTGKNVTAIALPASTVKYKPAAYSLTSSDTTPENISQSLSKVLKLYLPERYPDIKLAAELSGFSASTIKRQLAKANVTFRGLIQQLRFEQACQMLETTDASIMDIAYELSYESPSNFARAFRCWTGVSPHEFRRQ